MPGAGSLVAANNVYNTMPRDGTVIGVFADTAPLAPLWKINGARYDATAINWLGSIASRGTGIGLVRSDRPIRTIDDALEAGAMAQYLELRARAHRVLRAAGTDVLDVTCAELPAALVDHYLAMKRAARL